jgi:RNA polymerase primary sigma factor
MNGETLEEIGETMDVSRERVRQIIARAIRKLRHPLQENNLKQYWDEMPA